MNAISEKRIESLRLLLQASSRICIVTHMHPDGDAIGSSLALKHFLEDCMGKAPELLIPDASPDYLAFLTLGEKMHDVSSHPEDVCLLSEADLIICLDFNAARRAGEAMEAAIKANPCPKVLIDHHPGPDTEQFGTVFSSTEVSSACEMLYQVLLALPQISGDASALPRTSATALMAGITTDTNNFANSVFPGTLRMASALLEAGVDRDWIVARLYNEYRENRIRAFAELLGSHMTISDNGVACIIVTRELMEKYDIREGELDGLVNIPLSIGKVKLSVFLKETEGMFRVSLRSKKGVSANRLAMSHFNGGGHELAAGGRLYIPADIPDRDHAAGYVGKVTADL